MIFRLLIMFFILFGFVGAEAQNISTATIIWHSVGAVNQIDNKSVAYNCSFTTQRSGSLLWTQGAKISTYTANSIDESWPDITEDGQVTYNVTSNQNAAINGTVKFAMSAGQISIHLKLLLNGVVQADYIFSITSTTIGK